MQSMMITVPKQTEATATLLLTPLSDDPPKPLSVEPIEQVVIGRGEECTLRLAHDSVSRRHALLEFTNGAWLISDLGSLNGTWRNGEQLQPRRSIALRDGDALDIGRLPFRVTLAGDGRMRPARRDPETYATRASLIINLNNEDPVIRELSWEQFRKRYAPVIVGFARNAGLPMQDAEDVLQDVMLGFFMVSAKFQYDPSRGRFRGYLKRTTLNVMRKRHRHHEPVSSLDSGLVIEDDAHSEALWEKHWADAIMARAMDEVRERFDEKTLEAFELYGQRNVPAEVVAERLGMKVNSVHQAKSRVREAITEAVERLRKEEG